MRGERRLDRQVLHDHVLHLKHVELVRREAADEPTASEVLAGADVQLPGEEVAEMALQHLVIGRHVISVPEGLARDRDQRLIEESLADPVSAPVAFVPVVPPQRPLENRLDLRLGGLDVDLFVSIRGHGATMAGAASSPRLSSWRPQVESGLQIGEVRHVGLEALGWRVLRIARDELSVGGASSYANT